MRLFHVGLLSTVFGASVLAAVAQDKPNLTGKWIFERDDTPASAKVTQLANGARTILPESQYKNGNLGPEFRLTHEGQTLKLEWTPPNGLPVNTTYVLDGSETQHRKADVNGQTGEPWTSRSSWQESVLVITSIEKGMRSSITAGRTETSPISLERKQSFSLTPDGKLVSETTSRATDREWRPIVRSIYKKG